MDLRACSQSESYQSLYTRFRALSAQYGDIPIENVMSAYVRASSKRMGGAMDANPYVQNRRVKEIQSLPGEFTKNDVAQMICAPQENELGLRQVAHGLEYTAYPLLKLRKTYQDIMTYRYYSYPCYLKETDAKSTELLREWELIEKLSDAMRPAETAHKITGQAIQEGKVFYAPRMEVDKAHGKANAAFLQQLPSDYIKIVGLNSESGYTVAFNLFYLFRPGVCAAQYGDLLLPYLDDFNGILTVDGENETQRESRHVIYGSAKSALRADGRRVGVSMERFRALSPDAVGSPELYRQNGRWAYWVTLPTERVWAFGIDDTSATVAPVMTGLFLSMLAIAKYEQVQMELVQNPLVAIVTGEIPYTKSDGTKQEDLIALSDGGRAMFELYWNQMMAQNNTSGIGLYTGPFANMQLHQLAEAPGATEISTKGYQYTIKKSGLAGLIPVDDNPRAGIVNFSATLEARFCQNIYSTFSRMMESLYRRLHLRYTWKFKMFGDIVTDKETLKDVEKSMASGILPDLFLYNALRERSTLDDLSMSRVIARSGVMDLRLPLVSSYNMSQKNQGLPPAGTPAKTPLEQEAGGRPAEEIENVASEGTEDGKDN